MEGLLGKTLDRIYRIDRLLGRGGMGAVYVGHDTSLDRDVAIKVMHPHFADDTSFCARFRQEARAIASLNHPGIVQVYACGQDLGVLYIVMDFVRGQTLEQWLKRLSAENKMVALIDSLRIVRHVALALHYAHEKGVLHRDVKPANILLRPTDPTLQEPDDLPFRPVLTDFGLAKLADGGVHTQTGIALGTPTYMSPEQCRGQQPDRRSDTYSLGVVLYELVTGRVPFAVKSITDAIRCHTEVPPPPPRSVNPSLSVEVENVVLRALAKQSEDRFSTAREMADALQDVIAPAVGPVIALAGALHQPGTVAAQPRDAASQVVGSRDVFGALNVTLPDGEIRQVSLHGQRSLSIGRTDENDLSLPDSKVSRRHARMEADGQDLVVTDLHSTNGTFLGDSRLLPGIPTTWTADKPLRIGDTVFRLQRSHPEPPTGETMVDLAKKTDVGLGQINVSTTHLALEVDPGGRVTATFTAANTGPRVDHLETSVEGVPSHWIVERPPVIRLLPDDGQELAVTFAPPRTPQSRAGNYPITICVASQADPAHVAEIEGTLRVTAYYELALDLHPQKQTGVSEGTFEIHLGNGGNADLDVQLAATDPEEGCQYAFSPPQATVLAGGDQGVRLSVRPRVPLPGEMTRSYTFSVTARSVMAPDIVRQVQGQWVQISPNLEAELQPQAQRGTDQAVFHVRVTNRSLSDLDVTLEAVGATAGCTYALQPPQVTVPAAAERAVQLDVRASKPLYGKESICHAFAVTVQPVGAPRFARQVRGEWTQMPRRRSLWPPALFMIVGWSVAWMIYWVLLDESTFEPVFGAFESIGIQWDLAVLLVWALRGAIVGLIGGASTGLVLRWAAPALRWGQVLWIALVWCVVWAIGIAAVPFTELPFAGGMTAILFWAITGGIVGTVGGLFTGGALRRAHGGQAGGSVLLTALGWGLGWAAAELLVEGIVQSGLADGIFGPYWMVPGVLLGITGSAIGGGIVLGQLGRTGHSE